MFLLIIGVALVLVGALIYHELAREPIVRIAAAVLVIVGVILAIVGVVDLADVHTDAAMQTASYGTGRLVA